MSDARLSWQESWRLLEQHGGLLPEPWPEDPGEQNTPSPGAEHHTPSLREKRFDEIDFANLTLPRTLFDGCRFHAVSFHGSDLHLCCLGGDFIDCDFSEVNLTCADLSQARFFGCRFTRAVLIGCELRGATWEYCDFTDANFTGSRMDRALKNVLPLSDTQRRIQVDWRLSDDIGPDEEDD